MERANSVMPEEIKHNDQQGKARRIVFDYVKARLEKTDIHVTFAEDEVYVVWFCYILGGWKALVSTTLPDGRYYEVTYDKEQCRTYLDNYVKVDNVCVPDEEFNMKYVPSAKSWNVPECPE